MFKPLLTALTLAAIFTGTTSLQAENVIPAEAPTAVELSNTDINRIVCPGPLNDLIFSKEKGMTGHFAGKNAFVKFKIEDNGTDYVYAHTPSELFVVCNNTVYTLIVTPVDIPSVTLRLASLSSDTFKKNISHYKNLPLEKRALQIINEAYNETYPSSYQIAETDKQITLSADLSIRLTQIVDVEGVGLRLKKYIVKSLSKKTIGLDEKIFLSPSISNSILAVAVEHHNLQTGESSRVFVVDQKEQVQ